MNNRKNRKPVTKEIFELVIYMNDLEQKSITDICKMLNLNRKTVRSILNKHDNRIEFISESIKRRNTCKE